MSQKETIHQQSDFSAVLSLFRYGHGRFSSMAIAVGLILLATAALMISANFMGQLAEALIATWTWSSVVSIIAVILTMELIHVVCQYLGRVHLVKVTNRVSLGIRKALFRKMSVLPITYFDQEPLGRTVTRLTSDVEGIESFFSNTLPRMISACITIVIVLAAMIITDLKIGLVMTAASLPALVFTVAMRSPVRFWLKTYKSRSAQLNARLAENISGLAVIKLFGLERWSNDSFEKASLGLLAAAYKLMNWNSFIRPLAAFLCFLPMLVILWWGGTLVLQGSLGIGLLVAFVRYTERFFRPIMMISFELHLIQDAIASSDRVRAMLTKPEEGSQFDLSGQHSANLKGRIEFDAVSMSYGGDRYVLKDVSFAIEAGEKVALVGQTGSGKSSTISLIPRLYPFQRGTITLDGIPIEDWQLGHLRSQIGVVSQDVAIFHGSIRENLLAALPEGQSVSDEELWATCKETELDQMIEALPQKLDTVLHDNGSNLSMGEKQLLAFTRMQLRAPKLFILDEATANIDEHYEAKLQQALEKTMRHKTCIVIAHRLNTIRNCDRIIVFEAGRIVEQGTYAQLIAEQGYFKDLVERQVDAETVLK